MNRTLLATGALLCATSCSRTSTQHSSLASTTHPPQSKHPHTAVASAMLRHVENAQNTSQGDAEMRNLRQRLAANPRDLDSRILLARLYLQRNAPDLALEHYRVAAAQSPGSIIAALSLAKMLREIDEPEEALVRLKDCLALHPEGNPDLFSLQGILQDEQGRHARAEESFRKAVALEPNREALHNNLGYNLLLQNKPVEAAAEFRKALVIDPHSDVAHNNLAIALASRGAPESEALSELKRGAKDTAVAHSNLAAVMLEQGRVPEARAEIETALEMRRNLPAALENLRIASETDGKPANLPSAKKTVNFRSWLASRWVKITHSGRPKPAEASTPAAGMASASMGNLGDSQ